MIKRLNINGHDVTFVCSSRGTRNGFAHDCELYIDERFISEAHCYYYNRTWERYQYQTAMKNAVAEVLKELYEETEMILKEEEGWSRITKDRRATIDCIYNDSADKQFYDKIYGAL